MIKYVHGSKNSLDYDVHYVFNKLPSFRECQKFCSESSAENRNIIVVNNGIVTNCFKGTCDEINNALIETYPLHKQLHPLLITKKVKRDVLLKDIRVLRGILSYLTRTEYRDSVKRALHSNFTSRLFCASSIDFNVLNKNLGKNYTKEDILKTFAFQLGQVLGLHDDIELYTKIQISNQYKELEPYINRIPCADLYNLITYIQRFLGILNTYDVAEGEDYSRFIDFNRKFNIRKEIEIYE